MKKVLAVVLPLGILAGGLVILADQNRKYENKVLDMQVTAAFRQSEQELALQKATATVDATMVSYDKLKKECEKGLLAYSLLTPAQKAKTAAPTCQLAKQ